MCQCFSGKGVLKGDLVWVHSAWAAWTPAGGRFDHHASFEEIDPRPAGDKPENRATADCSRRTVSDNSRFYHSCRSERLSAWPDNLYPGDS
jgi:hypothetical protein